MLEDRDYMREPDYGQRGWRPRFGLRWSCTTILVMIYLLVLIAEYVTAKWFPHSHLFFGGIERTTGALMPGYLALSKEGLEHGFVWQLITYQFLHGGLLHLVLNAWALIIFGGAIEQLLGVRRYLALTFASGILGGIFQVLTAVIWPGLFGGEVVGASAGVFGLVAAFAMIFPERELTMLVFFVIPVHMRAKTLLIISAVIAVMGIVFPMGNMANAAHLGGMAMGWFYVRRILRSPALIGADDEASAKPPRLMKKVFAKAESAPADEISESDVDAILDKISARGIQSLTAPERAVLEAARKKMAQR